MTLLLLFTALAFIAVAKIIQAAPTSSHIFPTTLPDPSLNVQVQALDSVTTITYVPLPPYCSAPFATCDMSLLQQGNNNENILAAIGANCDTKAIAKEYVVQKDNLESFILQFIGNFNSVSPGEAMDSIAAWWSVMSKMTVLWGPLLQAPFFDTDVSKDDLKAYKQKLFSVMQGSDETPCATEEYGQADGIPYAIGFPLYDMYNAGLFPVPAQVRSTWWTMDYTRTPMHVQYDMNTNTAPSCDTESITYEKDVAKTTSATNSYSISDSFTLSTQTKTTTEVNAKMAGMGASVKEEVTVGFSNTIAASYSESTTVTRSTTTKVSNSYTAHIPPFAFSNVTQYVDQVHVNLGYTNDVEYLDSQIVKPFTSLQKQYHAGTSTYTTTMAEIKELVVEAAKLLGVTFTPFFEDVITTASVTGTASTVQGMAVNTLHNACDLNAIYDNLIPPNECTALEAMTYPPGTSC
eukprot:Clim_evm8s95 gene=Clim_evmTU8s95